MDEIQSLLHNYISEIERIQLISRSWFVFIWQISVVESFKSILYYSKSIIFNPYMAMILFKVDWISSPKKKQL
jgi:hypothetical protein